MLQDRIKAASPKAIILSGGPNSVHIEGAPRLPEGFFEYVDSQKIPVLGICYGMQLLVHELGGKIKTVAGQQPSPCKSSTAWLPLLPCS